ncbi:glutamine amidotransferase subunit hisH [Alcanivorax hongdengensis A-11-3]|uniref:Imidazole glycerol phosphate synthase subunit HisH n=1 Tax=Alcanivorax hongdengensis A-11-3 TaxID=1177179 RepID=L0WH30_9GAMM|nr:imidazole glycerol phosphate synthase subunit HisH [Alcanivorax hongdengensis]EKF75417.1 glutamine amidotransferase subunit hisH [Alcanivorax hongdengensis A-11-3]
MSEVVAVIDYGMGNLHSASKALEKVASGQTIVITSDPDQVRAADRVVFPGVGAIRDCIAVLKDTGLDRAIVDVVASGKPLLGICVGMQALMARSEENRGIDCLGVFDGQVTFFGEPVSETGARLKVPHMGWNQVQQMQAHPMWAGIADESRFYFVHSYCVTGLPDEQVAGRCQYGLAFAAAAVKDNVFAVQFHPEKSADAGLTLLENFLRWQP